MREFRSNYRIIAYTALILSAVVGTILSQTTEIKFNFFMMFIIFAVFIISDITISNHYKSLHKLKNKEVNDYYTDLRERLIDSDKKNEREKTKDVLELMTINMKEIKDYYVLSKSMAKKSFTLSVSMCILGFILISSAIISLFILDTNLSSVIIPVVGGAIVEVIAGTSLIVYKQSLIQLNKYYEALHDNERFLSIVNIVNKITPEKRDDVYIQIINSQFKK